MDRLASIVRELEEALKVPSNELLERVQKLAGDNKQLQRKAQEQARERASEQGSGLADQVAEIGSVHFLAATVEGDAKTMMQTLDSLRSKFARGVFVLATVDNAKLNMVVAVSNELTDRLTAPDLLAQVGTILGVKGGGRPDMARAGGSKPEGDLQSQFAQAYAAARDGVEAAFG